MGEELEGTRAYRRFRDDHRLHGWLPDRRDRFPSRWDASYRLHAKWGQIHYDDTSACMVVQHPTRLSLQNVARQLFTTPPPSDTLQLGGSVLAGLMLSHLYGEGRWVIDTLPELATAGLLGTLVVMCAFTALCRVTEHVVLGVSRELRRSCVIAEPAHRGLLAEVSDLLDDLEAPVQEVRHLMWEASSSPDRATLIRDTLQNAVSGRATALIISPDESVTTQPVDDVNSAAEDAFAITGGPVERIELGSSLLAWVPRSPAATINPGASRLAQHYSGNPKTVRGTMVLTGVGDSSSLSAARVLTLVDRFIQPGTSADSATAPLTEGPRTPLYLPTLDRPNPASQPTWVDRRTC